MPLDPLPALTLADHDHRDCPDRHACLVEALTQQAEWAVWSRQIERQHRRSGQLDVHWVSVSC